VTEHLSPVQLEDWRRRRLTPEKLLGADDHLAECAECRRLLELALHGDAPALYAELATDAAAGAHLTFEQSADYADGLLVGEERRMVEDHLASCAQCAPLMADLRAFRSEIMQDLDHEYRPETLPQTESLLTRVKAVLPAPLLRIPIWVYAAAPALLLLAVAWWFAWRSTDNEKPPQFAGASPTPTTSPSVSPAAPSPPPEAATVIVKLKDGPTSLTLDAKGAMTGVDQWPSDYQRLAREALEVQRVERSPLLEGLSRPGSSLMGVDDEGRSFAVIEPAGKVTLSDRPTFHWSRLSDAAGYVVEVYDERFNRVSSSPLLSGVSWAPPPLARGQVYLWQVKAIRDGQEFTAPRPPAPQARFRILDQTTANEIAQARRDYASSHLLLGVLYARAGLLKEAEQELRTLQKANPDVEVARRLLANVRALRR